MCKYYLSDFWNQIFAKYDSTCVFVLKIIYSLSNAFSSIVMILFSINRKEEESWACIRAIFFLSIKKQYNSKSIDVNIHLH